MVAGPRKEPDMPDHLTRRDFARFAAATAATVVTSAACLAPSAAKERVLGKLDLKQFRIAIPDADVDDLKARLARTRWPDTIPGSGWDYGVDLAWARDMAGYWGNGFDWRKEEAKLNAFPQFTTTIDGQNIHFLHVRSPEPNALPVILT